MKKLSFLLVALVLTAYGAPAQDAILHTKVTGGNIVGKWNADRSVASFKAIPFAAPPVGELRWRAPQPVRPWLGILQCHQFSASPMQNKPAPFMMWSEEFIAPPEPVSEDCLYLNVWTSAKSTRERLPVLVWIYGGGFVSGSSACAIYDGEQLAQKGIVFVSINYRVGVFGFMSHPELTRESGHAASGNYALQDQIAALKWVQENIAAFGGDPSKVTIAGQSAGSFAVQALVASPLAKGLFRGAIAHSGASFGRSSTTLQDAEKTGVAIERKARVTSLSELRQLSADSVLKVANTFPFGTFVPITDGYVLPEPMDAIFKNKKQNDVPLLCGWVTGDGSMAGPPKSATIFQTWVETTYGNNAKEFLRVFPAATDEEAKKSQLNLGILNFAAWADHVWALSNTSPTYVYQFSYVPTDKPGFPNYGAFHTSDVPFALHTLSQWKRPWRTSDYYVEQVMSGYWLNFVKTGNPNGTGLPEWTKYDEVSQPVMELNAHPNLTKAPLRAELKLLESIRH